MYFSATCLLPFQCYEPEIMGSNSVDKGTCWDCKCLQSVSYCQCTIKNWLNIKLWNSLLQVVCRIGGNLWIKLLQNSIRAQDDNAMLPCFQKFIVKQNFPLLMHELPSTMSCKCGSWCTAPCCLTWSKLLERIWKLQVYKNWMNDNDNKNHMNPPTLMK